LFVVLPLPIERVVAEAKRWSLADEVGLQLLPTGEVRVSVRTDTGRAARFIEHLSAMVPASLALEAELAAADADGDDDSSSRDAQREEWREIVQMASRIDTTVASGGRIEPQIALRLARAVVAFDGSSAAESATILLPRKPS
jgi:hypothetical protein